LNLIQGPIHFGNIWLRTAELYKESNFKASLKIVNGVLFKRDRGSVPDHEPGRAEPELAGATRGVSRPALVTAA